MLRACRRVLKPGGRIAYYNIFIAEDLPDGVRRQAAKARPGVYTRAAQVGLLRSAGFARIDETDVTAEFERVQRALYEAGKRHEHGLRRAQGDAAYEERQAKRLETLDGLARGLIRRSFFVAERPERRLRG